MDIPVYTNVQNFGLDSAALRAAIDASPEDREWKKVPILISDDGYQSFLCAALRITEAELASYGRDFVEDKKFYETFGPRLIELERMPDAGDLRLNSLVPYFAARALKPGLIIETGVAAGKSSALFLLGLEHNGHGKLVSIDLP